MTASKKIFISFTLFLILLGLLGLPPGCCPARAQDLKLSSLSKKARKSYEEAVSFIAAKNYAKAAELLIKAIEADDGFVEAHLMLGDVYAEQKKVEDALREYQTAISLDSVFFPNAFYLMANLELASGRYVAAERHIETYLMFPGIHAEKRAICENKLKRCRFALDAMANPVPFHPVNMGDSINTEDDEYINAVTADDQHLFFTRKLRKNETVTGKIRLEEDFFRADRSGNDWFTARPLGPPVNTGGDEGALCISPDGMDLYFAAGYRDDGLGRFDLYHSYRQGQRWTSPINLGKPVNTETWDSQPSVSSDGRTLFFSSLRKGGLGSSDLWMAVRQPDGQWSDPVNLGDKINTPQSEMNPFIHPDGQTLYFSSSGHLGMGGYDLFYSRKGSDGQWTDPVNLGYPINSFTDELNLIVNARGDLAYFSSDKWGGAGKEDIYSFELYNDARPVVVNYMKGKVFDALSKRPLAARFELINLSTGITVVNSGSERNTGEFLVALPTGSDYALHVSREGYLFFSENISLEGVHKAEKPFLKDIPMHPIQTGEIVILNNIFFETDKSELLPTSRVELERLYNLLTANPEMKIEIRGHTDNIGGDDYNQKLSEDRARVVFSYLKDKGVDQYRLNYKGFGETLPIADNSSEEGRRQNRRTEFKVVEK